MKDSDQRHHLKALKALTLSLAGISRLQSSCCRLLAYMILDKTGIGISENTIRRIFGFAVSQPPPSSYALDTLSLYCGYLSWDDFCRLQSYGFAPQPDFFPLLEVLTDTNIPTVIVDAEPDEFSVLTANKAYRQLLPEQQTELRGLPFWNAFFLEKEEGNDSLLLFDALLESIRSGQVVQAPLLQYETISPITHLSETSWWEIQITPVSDAGTVKLLVLHVRNVTERVSSRYDIEEAIMKELTMAEDLAVSNVRLNKALERLGASNYELSQTKRELQALNHHLEERVLERTDKLFESESRQRLLINNAPVAIAVLKGPDHIIETANRKIITYWGKDDTVLGKPLAEALPELEGQPFIEILNEVRRSGVPYINPELSAWLEYDGTMQTRHFDMIYQPVQHHEGITDSIYIIATDITDHVRAKLRLQESEAMLRLALSAVRVGSWTYCPETENLDYNSVYAEILGWEHEAHLNKELVLEQVEEAYKEELINATLIAIADGTEYDVVYPIKRFNDGEVIRVRESGKASGPGSGKEGVISGIIREL
ncbi:PAS domain S-box protein [Mucilaginibacter corticis]|uniref:PAS domain S-box protein n=1 Tax=Mucilaginibacter corticis TaxID=2597670 RepID=A0A556MMH6_9SPHI|nr:PAS domain-containing protein [Mucilaginibacter corticis]TSJ41012.1 PAS domain S-box protein [Mucilaginibacter corticis]